MHAGKLSGSYVGGKSTRHTYRYEATFKCDGDSLRYRSRVWCDGDLRVEASEVLRSAGGKRNDTIVRLRVQASVVRLANRDSRMDDRFAG